MTVAPSFYECNHCGFLHPLGFAGACADLDHRFTPDELDELHGEDGWIETDDPGEPTTAPKAMADDKPNLARIQKITATTDLFGQPLEVGCKVRVFHFYDYDPETDQCRGVSALGEGQGFWEGTLTAIGQAPEDPNFPGPRYTIKTESDTYWAKNNTNSPAVKRRQATTDTVYPPVNGTPVHLRGRDLGWRTFGVFRITDDEK
jgi:hypothetical protein